MNKIKRDKFLTKIIIMLFLALILALGIIAFFVFKNDSEKKREIMENNNNNNNGFNPTRYFNHHYSDSEKTQLFHKLKWMLNSPYYLAIEKIPPAGLGQISELNVVAREKDRKEEHFLADNGDRKEFKEIYQKYFKTFVGYCDLHPSNWEEIIKLIKERNQQKKEKYQETLTRFHNKIEQEGAYYYVDWEGSDKSRRYSYNPKNRQYNLRFHSSKNGSLIHFFIPKNHSVLTNFSFQTGVYQITNQLPIKKELLYNGEGGSYWYYFIDPQDQITIKLLPDFSY